MEDVTLNSDDIKKIFYLNKDIMETNKDYLCQLDSTLGDGDIGLTAYKGFKSVTDELYQSENNDIGFIFKKSGFVLAESVPSTIGTILASAFMQAGKDLKGKNSVGTNEMVTLLNGMIEGIQKRGKAAVGDKTILDSLSPALESLKENNEKGTALSRAIESAYNAANEGVERTKKMQSRHGRAERYFEKSIGHQDPGATVGALFIKGFYVYFDKFYTK